MPLRFTPAAERALREAAQWHDAASDAPAPAALLLGVLSESESHAADMLCQHAVTTESVLAHWPDLQRDTRAQPRVGSAAEAFAGTLRRELRAVDELLFDFPRPLDLATEHLLLGVLLGEGPVAAWLAQRGLSANQLLEDIRRWYGLDLDAGTPIDLPDEEGESAAPAVSIAETASDPTSQLAVLRILDASANRAREGLRVVEDYARFALDDAHLSRLCKEMRHDLTAALAALELGHLIQARDTQRDVGTSISTPGEAMRGQPAQVAVANLKRVQEALRSLEEYGKLVSSELAASLEQLRYRSYTLERALAITADSRARLAACRLYVLIDGRDDAQPFRELATALVDTGVHVLQLRDKRLDDRALLERAYLLREVTRDSGTLFVMNDRPDIARLAQADGVHVGQEELPLAAARAIYGAGGLVGLSTHDIAQARQAVLDGASYIGVGPTFPSATKQFAQFTGLELLAQVAAEIALPAFAIGGITLDNLDSVLSTGVRRVAVASAIVAADRPAEVAQEFLRRLS